MKKFFSLVLALVIALSLTTVAWGAPTIVTVTNDTELKDALLTNADELVINLAPAAGVDKFIIRIYEDSTVPYAKSVTINGTDKTKVSFDGPQVRIEKIEKLTINDCEILHMNSKSWGHLVFSTGVAGGVYTVSNCLFNGADTQGIYTNPSNGNEKYVIENCTFTGDFGTEGAVVVQNNSKPTTLTVSGNNFSVTEGEGLAILCHKSNLSLTSDVDEVVLVKSVEDFKTAVTTADAGDTIKLMVDVTLTDDVVIDKPITINENGKTLTGTLDVDDDLKMVDNGNNILSVVEKVYVAEVDGVKYEKLADAIAAADAGDTVKLLANNIENVTVGKEITIDFNGFTASGIKVADGMSINPDGTVSATPAFSTATTTFTKEGDYYVLNANNVWEKVEYVAADEEDGAGNIAYFDGADNYVICKKSDAGALMLTSGMQAGDKLLGYVKVAPVEYTMEGTKVAASSVVNCTTDFHAKGYKYVNPVTGVNEYYVDSTTGTTYMLVGGEVKQVAADATAIIAGHILKLNKTNALDAAKTTYEYKCVKCGAVFKGVTAKAPGVAYTTYEWDADLDAAYAANGYNTTGAIQTKLYLIKGASAPSTGSSTDKTVTSAQTFDAGIAMYVGMSVMAAAGSVVVFKKRED